MAEFIGKEEVFKGIMGSSEPTAIINKFSSDEGESNYRRRDINGKANAGLTLGIIGTALGAWALTRGRGGILGGLGSGLGSGGGSVDSPDIINVNGGGSMGGFGGNGMLAGLAMAGMLNGGGCHNNVQNVEIVPSKYELARQEQEDNIALTNAMWQQRVNDVNEKSQMFMELTNRDNAQDMELQRQICSSREKDLNEKFDIYTRLNGRISEIEKTAAANAAALPLMFELSKMTAEKYASELNNQQGKEICALGYGLQRQLDHKIDGELKYAYSNLCAPVPSLSPLYCSPFTPYGSGTTWNGCCGQQTTGCCQAQ